MSRKIICWVVLPVLIILEIVIIFSSEKSNKLNEVDEIKKENIVDRKIFEMYIENESGEYERYMDSKYFPYGRYKINGNKTKCVNKAGQEVEGNLKFDNGELLLISSESLFCYLYFDIKADIAIGVSTDGKPDTLPTIGGYKNTLNCTDATYSWNQKYQRVEFSGVTSDEVRCELKYNKESNNYTKLRDEVENKAIEVADAVLPKYDSAITLTESDYVNPTLLYSAAPYISTGTEVNSDFTFDGKSWNSNPGSRDIGKYYHFKFSVLKEGYYQLCYNIGTGSMGNHFNIYKSGVNLGINGVSSVAANASYAETGCTDLGNLSTSDYIDIVHYTDTTTVGKETIAKISFYLQKSQNVEIYKTGYRYSGKEPNNYIWFNNEMWRIIGSVPTKIKADGTKTNLVKIIRNETLGYLNYDIPILKATGDVQTVWGKNDLYKVLNKYYYGKKNGTDTEYCFKSSNYGTSFTKNCDFTKTGISENVGNYYTKMIENVYWNIGTSGHMLTASNIYLNEISNQSIQANVGIMNVSDYGFATDSKYHSKRLDEFYSKDITLNNWLFSYGNELTINAHQENHCVNHIDVDGTIDYDTGSADLNVRPVVYLDSDVYIIRGNGSITNPYIVGM